MLTSSRWYVPAWNTAFCAALVCGARRMRLRALFPFARRICWVLRSILLAALIFWGLMKKQASNGNSSGVFERLKLKCKVESESWSFGEGEHLFSVPALAEKSSYAPRARARTLERPHSANLRLGSGGK